MAKTPVHFTLLRGVCQTPAYIAYHKGFLAEEGIEATIDIAPTAWLIPGQLESGKCQFSVMPWTRVAASKTLIVCCGSGIEEAAVVLRKGLSPDQVRKIAVPREGGIKDLTAMALIESMGWGDAELVRQPSGDGAIIAFFARGADAASMVEPYATAMEALGVGTVLKRTGDVWPGAPGCSLATSKAYRDEKPDVVQGVVNAYARAAQYVADHPDEAAAAAVPYIGIDREFIERALHNNRPDATAIRNDDAMQHVLGLMQKRGYIQERPTGFVDLSFLDNALAG